MGTKISVRTDLPSRWRIGTQFTTTPMVLDVAVIGDEKFELLKRDPYLRIRFVNADGSESNYIGAGAEGAPGAPKFEAAPQAATGVDDGSQAPAAGAKTNGDTNVASKAPAAKPKATKTVKAKK